MQKTKKTIGDVKLKNEADKQVIDFLKDVVAYLEKRIVSMDNKASILIAVQGLFLILNEAVKPTLCTVVFPSFASNLFLNFLF